MTVFRSAAARVSRQLPEFRGKRRVIRLVDRALRSARADGFVHASGARFALGPGHDLIEHELFYCGDYAREVRSLLHGLLARRGAAQGGTVWDVGANIGSVGLPLAAERPDLQVCLFEPSPSVLARLARSVRLNPELAPRLRVHGFPLTDRPGLVEFWPSVELHNSGVGGLAPSHNRVASPILLHGMTGDALIAAGAPRPDVIKIDVEGFELEVLRGCERLLGADPAPAIMFEHSAYRMRERSLPKDRVVRWLREHGFRVLSTLGGRLQGDVSEAELEQERDFVAYREATSAAAQTVS